MEEELYSTKKLLAGIFHARRPDIVVAQSLEDVLALLPRETNWTIGALTPGVWAATNAHRRYIKTRGHTKAVKQNILLSLDVLLGSTSPPSLQR